MVNVDAFVKSKFDHIDGVFVNAGIMPVGPVSVLPIEIWNAMIDINMRGLLNMAAAIMLVF